ncbi:hypothetical protein WMY93_030326 [Mugilogobius chulae]|uniref:Uncharacterized protein n=1 Tax=Mugilogobius chulae TaxID=88201 RepID=A0AAW0MFQ8_9GOBI
MLSRDLGCMSKCTKEASGLNHSKLDRIKFCNPLVDQYKSKRTSKVWYHLSHCFRSPINPTERSLTQVQTDLAITSTVQDEPDEDNPNPEAEREAEKTDDPDDQTEGPQSTGIREKRREEDAEHLDRGEPGTDGPKKASSEELSAPGAESSAATGHQPRAQRRDEVKTKPPGPMSQSPAATAEHSSWCRGSSEETLENLKVIKAFESIKR